MVTCVFEERKGAGYKVVSFMAKRARGLMVRWATEHRATTPEQLYPLAEALGQVGITRISALGCMSLPQAGWQHDGRFSLLDLVRMAEIEASAELAAQPLADYAD